MAWTYARPAPPPRSDPGRHTRRRLPTAPSGAWTAGGGGRGAPTHALRVPGSWGVVLEPSLTRSSSNHIHDRSMTFMERWSPWGRYDYGPEITIKYLTNKMPSRNRYHRVHAP